MSNVIIRAQNLSKLYRIGRREKYYTLRESLMNVLKAPFGAFRSNGGQPSSSDNRGNTIWALRDVSFEVKKGEVVGVIGRNGAGKSTLLKILSRVTEPTEGCVEIHGRVGSLLEVGTGFHPELTGRENTYLNGAILGMKKTEIDRKFNEIVAFAEVEKFIDTPVKHYSSGMSVRLAFAVAAHLEPEILLVDEVLAVGDAAFQKKCLGKMGDVTREGRTVLFVSHNMDSVRQLCQRAFWLEQGQIRAKGDPLDITIRYVNENCPVDLGNAGQFQRRGEDTIGKTVWVDSVELRDSSGNLCTKYWYGTTLRLIVNFGGLIPRHNFTVEWVLVNEQNHRISFGGANPMCGVCFGKNDTTIECVLGPLPLTTGRYGFNIIVRLWGETPWDLWENAAAFQVTHCDPHGTGFSVPSHSGGDFVIPQVWRSFGSSVSGENP